MAWMETMMLLSVFGISESSAATRRRRSCLAKRDGELRLDSRKPHSAEWMKGRKVNRTVCTLSDSDNLERLHTGQTFLKLLHEDS